MLSCTLQERDLEGLQTDSAFWEAFNEGPSDDEEITVRKDLTSKLMIIRVSDMLISPSPRDGLRRGYGHAAKKTNQTG